MVVRQGPYYPTPRCGQYHNGGTGAPLAASHSESVSVGNVIVGPTPQSSLLEFAGEKKRLALMSPRPDALGIPAAGEGWFMMGTMVRVIRFQSLFKVIGITGYTFRIYLNSPLLFGRSLLHLGERSIRIQFIALAIDHCY